MGQYLFSIFDIRLYITLPSKDMIPTVLFVNICEYNISVSRPSPLDQDQCVESEAAMRVQNEEMMAMVMEQYNNMSISMEEEKKAKLEQLYDQIVSFQESIDSAKATLETTDREADTDARVSTEAY